MTVHENVDERDLRYLKFVFGRAQGHPDQKIVEELREPDIDSPQVLYRRLKGEGYPVCPECGEAPVQTGHCQRTDSKRQARGRDAEAQLLPPASEAAENFREVIDELDRSVHILQFLKQWLKDGRFITEAIYTKESGMANLVYRREDFPDPGGKVGLYWESVCEEHGQDPRVQEFKVPIDRTQYGGAAWYPHDVLANLIGAYALSGRSLEHLLKVLHRDPTPADRYNAEKKRDELQHKARQLAAMVRGNRRAVTQGPKSQSVTPAEQIHASWDPRNLRKLGIDNAEVERITGLRLPHHKHKP